MNYGKTGRNEQCPCGSGKKYKKCHGSALLNLTQLPSQHKYLGHLDSGSTEEISFSNFPGEEGRISLVPDNITVAGQPGNYTATYVLSRPGHVPADARQLDFSGVLTGDSHLAITAPAYTHPNLPDAIAIVLETGTADSALKFKGLPNARGFLGKIESEPFEAQNFEDAESKAYHSLAPILSTLATDLDIPVSVFQVFVVEQKTNAISSRFTLPARECPLALPPRPRVGAEYSYYASLYREGLNSNSAVYRFLCLFKVIEGIRARRMRITQDRLAAGQEPIRLKELFPAIHTAFEEWLKPIYMRHWQGMALEQIFRPEILGKKFNYVIDIYLVPLRNMVAHAILDSGELGISSDDLLKLEKIHYWLPATRALVRRMLRNEFTAEFLSQLPLTGDIFPY